MPEPRNTTKYILIQGNTIVHKGITDRDIHTVEQEHQAEFPDSKILPIGRKTTRRSALNWRREEGFE
ncbi:MAG: hypothetical protein OXH90_02900 [Paracoccaceae bacterium]|nr:hypothetical protein [Paracoccaceae bacterium]MDE2916534.1 hypothetical protein [Paracoccaceae bacterium]